MTSTMVVTPYVAAPGRECGTCTLCCKVYALPELEKPPGVWCKHCAPGKGCKIHDAPPDPCRLFNCLWMTDGKCRTNGGRTGRNSCFRSFPRTASSTAKSIRVRPAPGAGQPYYDGLRTMSTTLLDERRHVIMFVGDEATLVMPDEALPLGKMTAARQFPYRTGLRPQRPDMARDEDLRAWECRRARRSFLCRSGRTLDA